MASNITAKKMILRKSFLTKFRQFSSSSSVANGIQKKCDKNHQSKVSSSKWNDFLYAFASKYRTEQG
ncbi:hypothetical protein CTI12_AA216800 [Artemisia annua]|uniref:Uncharacterized protein n=1 Tax=Artemisia annua TaxID=35608 RepID=A0A2U1NX97_ARTAN|nr:hypothetical protein CTI12_AA216800 [Artemisia annua]